MRIKFRIFVPPVIIPIFRNFSTFKFFGFLKPGAELVIEFQKLRCESVQTQNHLTVKFINLECCVGFGELMFFRILFTWLGKKIENSLLLMYAI